MDIFLLGIYSDGKNEIKARSFADGRVEYFVTAAIPLGPGQQFGFTFDIDAKSIEEAFEKLPTLLQSEAEKAVATFRRAQLEAQISQNGMGIIPPRALRPLQ